MPGESDERVPRVPELIGSTEVPFTLAGAVTEISLPIYPATGPGLLDAASQLADFLPPYVLLNVENITSDQPSDTYDVYLNLPPGESAECHPELRAGMLTLFGLTSASRSDARNPGHGLSEQFDITALYAALRLLETWDPKRLRVSFVPETPGGPTLRVGRVSLYLA